MHEYIINFFTKYSRFYLSIDSVVSLEQVVETKQTTRQDVVHGAWQTSLDSMAWNWPCLSGPSSQNSDRLCMFDTLGI